MYLYRMFFKEILEKKDVFPSDLDGSESGPQTIWIMGFKIRRNFGVKVKARGSLL
jgi:hypothetical protein